VVRRQHLLLCTLLIGNALAMEVRLASKSSLKMISPAEFLHLFENCVVDLAVETRSFLIEVVAQLWSSI
jgi:hypothetical protein